MKKNKVEVQKGELKVDMNSYKNMPFSKKRSDRIQEVAKQRDGRDMKAPLKK